MTLRFPVRQTVALAALSLGACAAPTGDLIVRISGEDAAEEGFRAADFADGWDITLDKVLVSVGHVTLSQEGVDAESQPELLADAVVDLHGGTQTLGTLTAVPAGRWDFGFEIGAPAADATASAGVAVADVTAMHEAGYAYWIEGTATLAERSVDFRLGFPVDAVYSECTNGVDDTDGVVVQAGAEEGAEITLHLEHFFYDKLGTHAGVSLRFEALAAAAGDDDILDNDELDAVLVSSVSVYDPGSADVTNLHDFMTQAASEMAHLNGEGICVVNGEDHDHEEDHE